MPAWNYHPYIAFLKTVLIKSSLCKMVIDFIKKQLKKNPNIAKVNAATLALAALYKKYPCQYE